LELERGHLLKIIVLFGTFHHSLILYQHFTLTTNNGVDRRNYSSI